MMNGSLVGTEPVLNFTSGSGILISCVDNKSAGTIDCTPTYDTALIPTHDTIHANESFCRSTNGTTGYTCSLPDKALLSYSLGQMFLLLVDTTCSGTCSLNIDGVGLKTITQSNGITPPDGDLIAGQAKLVWYDGTVMRLMF